MVKSYWLYRLIFIGCVALSIATVAITLSSRQSNPVRAQSPRPRAPIVARPPDQQSAPALPPAGQGTEPFASRVRVIKVAPFEREIQIHNFGDAAQDLSGWQLVCPRATGDATYDVPLGTVILPGESLSVVVDEGVD